MANLFDGLCVPAGNQIRGSREKHGERERLRYHDPVELSLRVSRLDARS